jgi:hypothetical protein
MEKEQFLTSFFRLLAFISPIIMIALKILEKKFKNIVFETIAIIIIILFAVFYFGFKIGSS